MTLPGLLMRLLWSRRAASLAVVLGMAVATAVITGALVLGQSVTGTLHDIALRRTGPVQYAVLAAGAGSGSGGGEGVAFFSADLAKRLQKATGRRCVAGILTRSQLVAEDASGKTLAAASGIQVIALEEGIYDPEYSSAQHVQRGPYPTESGTRVDPSGPEATSTMVQFSDIGGGKHTNTESAEQWNPRGQVRLSQGAAKSLNDPVRGTSIMLHLPRTDETIAHSIMARRGRSERLAAQRLTVGESVAGDSLRDSFELFASQRQARNAWVSLRDLQKVMGQPRMANIILVGPPWPLSEMRRSGRGGASELTGSPPLPNGRGSDRGQAFEIPNEAILTTVLKRVMTLDDYGLSLTAPPPFPAGVPVGADAIFAVLQARSGYLSSAVERAANNACEHVNVQRPDTPPDPGRKYPTTPKMFYDPVLTLLLTEVSLVPRTGASPTHTAPSSSPAVPKIHYALACGRTYAPGDNATIRLNADQVVLNDWTLQQLGAKVGDAITFRYLARRMTEDTLQAGQAYGTDLVPSAPVGPLYIVKSVPVANAYSSPSLTPTYEGLTDATSIRDWQPPAGFPFDPKLVTPSDEDYWQRYRTMPRLYLPLSVARRCGLDPEEGGGSLTSIRVRRDDAPDFRDALLKELAPVVAGITVRDLRREQLAAATGNTDFASLFLALSMVLQGVAVLLVVLLFRLLTEQQSPQMGLLLALGFSPARIRRLCLLQGAILATCGTLLGIPLGLGYAAGLIRGLTTWWLPALGTAELSLHLAWPPLLLGGVAGWLLALVAVIWALRVLRQQSPIGMLVGRNRVQILHRGHRGWGHAACFGLAAWAVGTLLALQQSQRISWPAAVTFLLVGLGSLIALLEFAAWRLTGSRRTGHGLSLLHLSWRNNARRPSRSLLTVWLIALAVFLLTTLSAFQHPNAQPAVEATGGYELIVTADQPLLGDLNTPAGRKLLGISTPPVDDPLWQRAQFTGLWVHDGQDVSCRNLTRPTSPRILGVPAVAGRFGKFPAFKPDVLREVEGMNAQTDTACLADEETATYLLHLGVGEVLTLPTPDRANRVVNLRLTNLLPAGIFQGELLISQVDFIKHFGVPPGGGPRVILVQCPAADVAPLRHALQQQLGDYSITVETAAERIAGFQAIANTYLATFQALGYLALFLGTLGLAIVLLRNLLERRAELALLAALGFTPRRRLALILLENTWLLLGGVAVGLLAALPALVPSWSQVHSLNLLAPLGLVLLGGLTTLVLVSWLALGFAGRVQLREE